MADDGDTYDPFDFLGFGDDDIPDEFVPFSDSRLEDMYDRVIDDLGYDDPEMREMFARGWDSMSMGDESYTARAEFEQFLLDHGIDFDEVFDWDDWRDYYSETAG